jgi:hypothetical protein
VDGERLRLALTLPTGLDIGALELRADLVESGGKKAWKVGRRMAGGAHMLSAVEVDAENFHPIASYWSMSILGTATALFKPGAVEIQREGDPDSKTVQTDRILYDNEQVMHMLRMLPLQVGYKTMIPVITSLGGGTIISLGVEVPKKEVIETPVGKFDSYKVELNINQTFWISDDEHRYLVKFDAGGALALLESVWQHQAGAPVPFQDDKLGVVLTAPSDWVFHVQGKGRRQGDGRPSARSWCDRGTRRLASQAQ